MRALVIAAILALCVPAFGQAADPPTEATPEEEARALFDRGVALANDNRWAEACPLFEQANALYTTGGTRLRLADCYEHIGEIDKARDLYRAIVANEGSETVPERVAIARDRLRRLDEMVAQKPAPAPPPPPAPLAPQPDSSSGDTALSPVPGALLLGVGGAAVIVGAVFGVLALEQEKDVRNRCAGDMCPTDAQADADAAKDKALAADITIGIGAAMAVTGGVLLIVSYLQGSGEHTSFEGAVFRF